MIAFINIRRVCATLALMSAAAAPASAQLASASTAALGLGENFTAAARGYNAAAWNPAGLGMKGNPGFSMTLLTLRGIAGLDPITLSDIKEYENELVPTSVKREWLNSIEAEGSQAGNGGGDVTLLGLQIGPVALQLSSSVRAVSDISPGVAELLLFGNADDEGNPRNISLAGSALNVNSYSTAAVSYGMPFTLESGARVSVGATAKYTMGHVMARGQESSGSATADPIGVNFAFSMVHTPMGDEDSDDPFEINNGSGIGLDLGVGYETGIWTFAATAQNIVNTFEWDESLLRYRPATIVFNEDENSSELFETQAFTAAPAALQTLVTDMKFKPSFAVGAAMQHSPALRVTADARFGSADGMSTRPPTHVGAGVEYRVVDFLPLRIGAGYVSSGEDSSGLQYGGGLGLEFGGYNLSVSALRRSTGLGADTLFMLTFLSLGI